MPGDEDNWQIGYPVPSLAWLHQVEVWCDYRYSPLEIIRTEIEYPGLIRELSLIHWQERLIKQQVDAEPKETGQTDDA